MGVYGSAYGHPETGVYLLVYAGAVVAFTGQPDAGWSSQDHHPTTWRAKASPTTFRSIDTPTTWRAK